MAAWRRRHRGERMQAWRKCTNSSRGLWAYGAERTSRNGVLFCIRRCIRVAFRRSVVFVSFLPDKHSVARVAPVGMVASSYGPFFVVLMEWSGLAWPGLIVRCLDWSFDLSSLRMRSRGCLGTRRSCYRCSAAHRYSSLISNHARAAHQAPWLLLSSNSGSRANVGSLPFDGVSTLGV